MRTNRGSGALLWVILIALLAAAGVIIALWPMDAVHFTGNSYYSERDLEQRFFGSVGEHRLLETRLRLSQDISIPFVEKYSVRYNGLREVTIQIYEKSLSGYFFSQGYYLYFDWDGTLVESSERLIEGVCKVSGLELGYAVLGETLPVKDRNLFAGILQITQFVQSQSVKIGGEARPLSRELDEIHFSGTNVSLIFDKVKVQLGDFSNLTDKLSLMASILPELEGKDGTLLLDGYTPGSVHSSYIFKENKP